MAQRSILGEDEPTEINLSAMIDCIFILLIFFIVTTVFVEEKGLQVNKPDAAATTPLEETESLVFEITADDKVLLASEEISAAEVTSEVRARVREADTPVTIRAHEGASHGAFVRVWDAARQGGAEALSFTTVN